MRLPSPAVAMLQPLAPRKPCVGLPAGPALPTPSPQAPLPGRSAPGSPRNNEAWAAPAASFAYRRGSANGLRRGSGTPCCHLRARVCASVTAAVAVALAVGGGPGGAQPRGDRPRRPLSQRVAAARPGGARRPPAPGRHSRDVGGGAEEAVPQSQPGREALGRSGWGGGGPGGRGPPRLKASGAPRGLSWGSEVQRGPLAPSAAAPLSPRPALFPERCHSKGFRGPGAEVAGRRGSRAGEGRAEACALRSAPPPYSLSAGDPGAAGRLPGGWKSSGARLVASRRVLGCRAPRAPGGGPHRTAPDPGLGLPMAVPRRRAVLAAPARFLLLESGGLARRRQQTRKQTVLDAPPRAERGRQHGGGVRESFPEEGTRRLGIT